MAKPRIIFAGTPDFAAACLKQLLSTDHSVVAVYTQPDRPAGRGKQLQPSPVKQLALQHGIPVEQPLNFKQTEDQQKLADYQADLMIVVAYGLLLPQSILDTPKLGCINVHASLLPRWRGAAPIQRAIEAGDAETGVGIMQMEAGLDTGPVWQEARCTIEPDETGSSLHDKLAQLGAQTLVETLPIIFNGDASPTPQSEGSTYAKKLSKQEAEIDWQAPAATVERKIRAFNSWPVAFVKIDNQPLRIWEADLIDETVSAQPGTVVSTSKRGITVACGDGQIRLTKLQPAGKRAMAAADVLNSKAHWFQAGKPIGTR